MGLIRSGLRSDKRITELMGTFVAMKFIGWARNIESEVPERGKVTQDVVRARVVVYNPDGSGGTELGETLVYPQVLARELTENQQHWISGILTEEEQRSDSSRSVIVLTPPENDPEAAFDRVEADLKERGLF